MSEIIEQIKSKLTEANAFSLVEFSEINSFPCITVPSDKILEIAKILKDEFKFDQLRDIAGVDRFTKELRFECIYNLYSTITLQRLFMRVKLDSKKPEVESLCSVWLSANWAEREAYDMV